MRIEDGVFAEYAKLNNSWSINDQLPLHDETFTARSSDVSKLAFTDITDRSTAVPGYKPDDLTVYNTSGQIAIVGDSCYKYPAMASKCVKIYTNDANGKKITVRPLGGADDGSDDVEITIFSGTMLPIACKRIDTSGIGSSSIIILG